MRAKEAHENKSPPTMAEIPGEVAPSPTLPGASGAVAEPSTYAYSVIVTNMGYAYRGDDEKEAKKSFDHYMEKSKQGFGQVGFERVTMYHMVPAGEPSPLKSLHPEIVFEYDPRKQKAG